jgi:predicted HTH transcriptional regulator
VSDKVSDKLTSGESEFVNKIQPLFDNNDWISNNDARIATGNSYKSVQRYLAKLTLLGLLESQGEKKNRQYRLKGFQ